MPFLTGEEIPNHSVVDSGDLPDHTSEAASLVGKVSVFRNRKHLGISSGMISLFPSCMENCYCSSLRKKAERLEAKMVER